MKKWFLLGGIWIVLFSFTGCRTGDLRASSEATKEMEAAANILIQCLDNKDVIYARCRVPGFRSARRAP